MPLGSPRRIFNRPQRRPGLRTAVLIVAVGIFVSLLAHPVLAALTDMLQVPSTPRAVSAVGAEKQAVLF